jgi:hypothetical protein
VKCEVADTFFEVHGPFLEVAVDFSGMEGHHE